MTMNCCGHNLGILWSRPRCILHNFFVPCPNFLTSILFSSFLTLVFECAMATNPTFLYSNEGVFPQSYSDSRTFPFIYHFIPQSRVIMIPSHELVLVLYLKKYVYLVA